MSEAIGSGDVVERLDLDGVWGWRPGDRAIVFGVVPRTKPFCEACGSSAGDALVLHPAPDSGTGAWCSLHWRRLGGSRADTVGRFAEHLTPQKVDACLSGFHPSGLDIDDLY